MTSEARITANRRNAAKSTGPRTPEGRAVVARTLDRLSMHERRIESSLYRTMNELRKLKRERESGSPPVETQHLASPQPIAMDKACCAKQSHCRPPAVIVNPLLRARPRVTYHYHNVGRSY